MGTCNSQCNTLLRFFHESKQTDLKACIKEYFEAVPNLPLTEYKSASKMKRFLRVLKVL